MNSRGIARLGLLGFGLGYQRGGGTDSRHCSGQRPKRGFHAYQHVNRDAKELVATQGNGCERAVGRRVTVRSTINASVVRVTLNFVTIFFLADRVGSLARAVWPDQGTDPRTGCVYASWTLCPYIPPVSDALILIWTHVCSQQSHTAAVDID